MGTPDQIMLYLAILIPVRCFGCDRCSRSTRVTHLATAAARTCGYQSIWWGWRGKGLLWISAWANKGGKGTCYACQRRGRGLAGCSSPPSSPAAMLLAGLPRAAVGRRIPLAAGVVLGVPGIVLSTTRSPAQPHP